MEMERAASRDAVDGDDGADHGQNGGQTKRCGEAAWRGVHET